MASKVFRARGKVDPSAQCGELVEVYVQQWSATGWSGVSNNSSVRVCADRCKYTVHTSRYSREVVRSTQGLAPARLLAAAPDRGALDRERNR